MPSGTGEAGRERAENCDPLSPGGTRVSETGTTRRDAGTISIDPRREAAEAETAACLRVCRRTALVTDLRHPHPSGSALSLPPSRSEERRVGNKCVRTCRSRWATLHKKQKKYI